MFNLNQALQINGIFWRVFTLISRPRKFDMNREYLNYDCGSYDSALWREAKSLDLPYGGFLVLYVQANNGTCVAQRLFALIHMFQVGFGLLAVCVIHIREECTRLGIISTSRWINKWRFYSIESTGRLVFLKQGNGERTVRSRTNIEPLSDHLELTDVKSSLRNIFGKRN